MLASLPYFHAGHGEQPFSLSLDAAWEQLSELPSAASTGAAPDGLGYLTAEGLAPVRVREFFEEALAAAKREEAIVESGSERSVSTALPSFKAKNLRRVVKASGAYRALCIEDRARADEVISFVCFHPDLHPRPSRLLDGAMLGDLINFPKRMFGFPFGGYSANGDEALSLCLFSYRQLCSSQAPLVLYVSTRVDDVPPAELARCCDRLRMDLRVVSEADLDRPPASEAPAVVLASFECSSLDAVSAWAAGAGSSLHVHLSDPELRGMLVGRTEEPVRFALPEGVRSMSLQEGLFCQGYQLHRDADLRDLYAKLPHDWQMSQSDASPGASGDGGFTSLFIDFCFGTLGWNALRDIAMQVDIDASSGVSESVHPITLNPHHNQEVLQWRHSKL